MQVNDAPRHWLRWGSSFFLVKISPHACRRLMLARAQTHALKHFLATPLRPTSMLFTSHWKDTILAADNHPAINRASRQRVLYALASQGDTQGNAEKRDNCDRRIVKVKASKRTGVGCVQRMRGKESLTEGREVRRTTTKLSLAELGSTFRSRTNCRVVCTRPNCKLAPSFQRPVARLYFFFPFWFFFLDA